MPRPYTSLYNPKTKPIKGMRSAVAAASLADGEYSLISNWRWDRRVLKVRNGHDEVLSTSLANAEFRGWWNGTLNGTEYVIVALWVPADSAVRLFKVADLTADPWTLSSISVASGAVVRYPGTHFTTNAFCTFAVARAYGSLGPSTQTDVLKISNGTEDCRIYDPAGTQQGTAGTEKMAIEADITAAFNQDGRTTLATFPSNMPVAGSSLPTYTAKDADMTIADTGSSPDNNTLITLTAGVDIGDWVKFDKAGLNLGLGRQIIFLYDADGYDIWPHLQVEISEDDSTYYTVWDGTLQTYDHVDIPDPESPTGQRRYIAFSHDHVTFAQKNNTRYIKITVVGSVPSSLPVTIDVFGIFAGGFIRGGAAYGYSYYHSMGRGESPGIVVPNGGGKWVKDMGGRPLDNLRIPVSPLLGYAFVVPYIRATTAQADTGVDYLRLYRKDEGSFDYYLVDQDIEASWNGAAWIMADAGSQQVITNGTTASPLIIGIPMPDEFHEVTPRGAYLLNANDRFMAANISGAVHEVWFSEAKQPFRFRSEVVVRSDGTFDPRSPGRNGCRAEVITGMVSLPASGNLNTVFIFTTESLWMLEGYDAYSLSIMRSKAFLGTFSPRAITTYRDSLIWLDADMQVRMLAAGQIIELSRYSVDDKLQAIPVARRDDVAMVVFKDRLYLAYAPAGETTNKRILVYNLIEREWEADDILPTGLTAEGLLVRLDRTNNTPKLYAITNGGGGVHAKIYELEQDGKTGDLAGTTIATRITTAEFNVDGFEEFYVKRLGYEIDDVSSGTLTSVVTYKPRATTQTFDALSVDVAAGQAYLWTETDPAWSSATAERGGTHGQVDIQGSLVGGKILHAIVMETEGKGQRAAR